MKQNNFDQYRPIFEKESLVRTVQNGSETIYLYQGRGLVPDSKTDKYLDYAPIKFLELPAGYESATASAFCQGCTLYKYPNQISMITNPDKQVVRITETISQNNFNWLVIPVFLFPILAILVLTKFWRRN
ncbi:hypothetical protein HZB69_00205 [Candidatus Amesbacteria bacterium]|nr:hypothetical protein [Candidatus Amesbacteria bacterium]